MSTFPASLLILNGKGANEPQLREAIALLREEGVDIHVRVTWEKGDAQRYVDEARQLGVETVIAGGGDGTINEVSTALIQAERYGTPLGTALRTLAQESRDQRMSAAEMKAAALPPKLTVPMILFFLPVLFAVILGPAGIMISERGGIFGR